VRRFMHKFIILSFALATAGGCSDFRAYNNIKSSASGAQMNIDGRTLFTCTPGQISKTPMLKLTNREFRNAIFALLDSFDPALKADTSLNTMLHTLPRDFVSSGPIQQEDPRVGVTRAYAQDLFEAAFRAGELAAGSAGRYMACLGTATLTANCHQAFVKDFASRAFRRPVNDTEAANLAAALWDASLSKIQQVQMTFAALTQTPDFLYRIYDRGTPAQLGPGVLTMNDYELADKLAFFLTGAPPDEALRAAASAGQMANSETLGVQVERLLGAGGARNFVSRLFRESYGYDAANPMSYPAGFLDGINTSGLHDAMVGELDTYFADLVLDQNASFRSLMTSVHSRGLPPTLAAVYNVSPAAGAVSLPAERAGFLNRAAMLARTSSVYTSPIKRGVSVLREVLCGSIGGPPPGVPTVIPEVDPHAPLTTRQRTATITENPGSTCLGCHSRINPLGYVFEHFDSLGRKRGSERIMNSTGETQINSLPLDTRAESAEITGHPLALADSADLTLRLADNDSAMMCFVRKLKRFEAKQTPSASDSCQMNNTLNAIYGAGGSQGSVKDGLLKFIQSAEFRRWSY